MSQNPHSHAHHSEAKSRNTAAAAAIGRKHRGFEVPTYRLFAAGADHVDHAGKLVPAAPHGPQSGQVVHRPPRAGDISAAGGNDVHHPRVAVLSVSRWQVEGILGFSFARTKSGPWGWSWIVSAAGRGRSWAGAREAETTLLSSDLCVAY